MTKVREFSKLIKPLIVVGAPFFVSIIALFFMLLCLPEISEDHRQKIKFPTNIKDLKVLGTVLSSYKGNCYWRILFLIILTYIFLQSFMIPGSVFFSVLLGYLFPFPIALLVVAFSSAVGASICYILASFIGSHTMLFMFPKSVAYCRAMISGFKHAMIIAILLLRLSPIIPNWLINIASPIIGIPLGDFFVGTFIGVVPISLFFVRAGTMLQELSDIGITSVASVYILGLFAIVSIVPFLFQKQLRERLFPVS